MTNNDELIAAMRAKYRDDNDLDKQRAVVGSSSGIVYDPSVPGGVFVRFQTDSGVLLPVRTVGGPRTYMPLTPGLNVLLATDSGAYYIHSINLKAQSASGGNAQITSAQPAPRIPQMSFETLSLVPTSPPGLTVRLKSWKVISGTTAYEFVGDSITLVIPATATNMYYAGIFVKADSQTTEVFYSTPRDVSDLPLGVTDENEVLALATAGSTPAWCIPLTGTTTAISLTDIQNDGIDWRQVVNATVVSSGGASATASYITKVAESGLSNEFALGSLATGLLKNTTATGVPTIAAAGTDYTSPTGTESLSNKTITASSLIATALSLLLGSFKAIFTHANTADRTYTFPDVSGTVDLIAATQTLSNKTLTVPTIGDFSNAQHGHGSAATGGQLNPAAVFSSGAVPVVNGGTGATSLAGHGSVLVNSGGTALTSLAPGTNRNIQVSDGTDWGSRALVAADLPIVDVPHGGTGLATLTANAVLIGNGTSPITSVAPSAGGNVLRATNPTTWASSKLGFNDLSGQNVIMCGRLTLTSAVPVTTSDVTAATTVYWTPYIGYNASLYNGSNWTTYSGISEISAAVPSTLFRLFDVFLYDNSGTLTLDLVNWNQTTATISSGTNATPIVITTSAAHGFSNGDRIGIASATGTAAAALNGGVYIVAAASGSTLTLDGTVANGTITGGTLYNIPNTRITALATQDGVYCKSGTLQRRYLGTCMTTGVSGQCEDSLLNRYLYNYNNRVPRHLRKLINVAHTYASATDRLWNGGATGSIVNNNVRIQMVQGLYEQRITYGLIDDSTPGAGNLEATDIAINSVTTLPSYGTSTIIGGSDRLRGGVTGYVEPPAGYCFINSLERSLAGTSTFNLSEVNAWFMG